MGIAVGEAVGATVGAAVGADVGVAVGEAVGTGVGAAVGTLVGAAVGTAVTCCRPRAAARALSRRPKFESVPSSTAAGVSFGVLVLRSFFWTGMNAMFRTSVGTAVGELCHDFFERDLAGGAVGTGVGWNLFRTVVGGCVRDMVAGRLVGGAVGRRVGACAPNTRRRRKFSTRAISRRSSWERRRAGTAPVSSVRVHS